MITIQQIKDKRSERKQLSEEAGRILEAAPAEGLAGDELTHFNQLHDRGDTLKGQIEALERQYDAEQSEVRAALDNQDPREQDRRLETVENQATDEENEQRHREIMHRYYFKGEQGLTAEDRTFLEERAALNTGTDAEGGYSVPATTHDKIEVYSKNQNSLELAGATVIDFPTNGKLEVPTIDDSGNTGDMGGEGNAATADATPGLGVADLTDYRFDSDGIQMSRQWLNSTVDVAENVLAELLGGRIGQAMQVKFTTGTGSSQPRGIVTAGTALTAAAAATLAYNDIIDLIYGVPQRYRRRMGGSVGFMMRAATVGLARKIKDDNNLPIFVAGGTNLNQSDSILGYNVTENADVAAVAASAKSIVFGDYSKYWIKKVGRIRIYRDPFTLLNKEQVQFYGFHDAGGDLANTEAVRVLTHPSA